MNIGEELARNRVVYRRMSGGAAVNGESAGDAGFPVFPPRTRGAGAGAAPVGFGLPRVSAGIDIPDAEPGALTAPPGVEIAGMRKATARDVEGPVYSLKRREKAAVENGVGRIDAPPVPEIRYPEVSGVSRSGAANSGDLLAALARKLEADARQQPQLHREGGEDWT